METVCWQQQREGALCAKLFKYLSHCVILIIFKYLLLWGYFCGMIRVKNSYCVWFGGMTFFTSCFPCLDAVGEDLNHDFGNYLIEFKLIRLH